MWQGVLLAEEETEITFRVVVNQDNAVSLNSGPRELDGTLILHTLLGKDHFITLTGEYREWSPVCVHAQHFSDELPRVYMFCESFEQADAIPLPRSGHEGTRRVAARNKGY